MENGKKDKRTFQYEQRQDVIYISKYLEIHDLWYDRNLQVCANIVAKYQLKVKHTFIGPQYQSLWE